MARMIGALLMEPQEKGFWTVATDIYTAKQKRQRAFAAEFLCPFEALTEYLKHRNDGYALEEAAQHFGVSPLTVETVLVNNGALSEKHEF